MESYDHRGRTPQPAEPIIGATVPGIVHRRRRPAAASARQRAVAPNIRNLPGQALLNPKLLLPLLLVLGTLLGAFLIQPSGTPPAAQASVDVTVPTTVPTTTPTEAPATPTAVVEQALTGNEPDALAPAEDEDDPLIEDSPAASNDVAGIQDEQDPTPPPDFSATAHCGPIQESVTEVSVAQTLHDVSVHVTTVAVYPIDYFICILGETGGAEAEALGQVLKDSEMKGATHAVVADLWVTNSGREFGQLNMNRASFTVSGLTNYPVAVLGSTTEVLITAGQGRGLTLVATVTNSVGVTTGPITLVLDPPLIGGETTAGKYQLFLPTP